MVRPYRKYSITTVLVTLTRLAHANAILWGRIAMMAYVNTLSAADKRRYQLKLKVLYNTKDSDNTIDPYQIDHDEWKDDITLWPSVEFGEIYTYLIDTPGPFTRKKMKASKSLEALNYYIRFGFLS